MPGFLIAAAALVLASGATASQRFDQPLPGTRSPRNANYDIDVRLEPADRSLHGREHIRWRNISANPTGELQFHLYWNAWRRRESLALNGVERLLTVSSIVDALGLAAIGLIACLAALIFPSGWALYSAALYLLLIPWKALNALYFGRKARTLRKLVAAPIL